jgi:hypothetical protein
MTTAPTTDQRDVEAALAALEQAFAGQPDDVLGDRIATIRTSVTTLRDVEAKLAYDTKCLRDANRCRKTLCDELFAVPSPIRTAKDRGTHRNLTLSIQMLDRGRSVLADTGHVLETLRLGQLMREVGFAQTVPPPSGEIGMRLPWFGSIPEVERRIRELTRRRDEAQSRLAAALAEPIP